MAIPDGWPCALLPAQPPSVADREGGPAASDLLPQVIAVAPRGPIWGTDEVSDGSGASPVMRKVWTALAGWLSDYYKAAFEAAIQTFPSAITYSLDDWEAEYGLPDPCTSPASGDTGRINAVRARYGAQGGASPAYFICLAASVGFDITITEPSDFICGVSECGGDDTVVAANMHHEWIVHLINLGDIWFYAGEGIVGETPLGGFVVATDLECILRRVAPLHTTLIFDYSGVA
ncbi:putative phage tail protein [Microvirga zambiensis]|uniref:putative phage tail protein n=1 Tax=Microvirga zambiensis TaxID=1402137 RepID=UPI00191F7601|nr:putative phage tail protein [Microvirga zambiensis]